MFRNDVNYATTEKETIMIDSRYFGDKGNNYYPGRPLPAPAKK